MRELDRPLAKRDQILQRVLRSLSLFDAVPWRNGLCATVIGALRKNQWSIGGSIGFFPVARQWRVGASSTEKSQLAGLLKLFHGHGALLDRWCSCGEARLGAPPRKQLSSVFNMRRQRRGALRCEIRTATRAVKWGTYSICSRAGGGHDTSHSLHESPLAAGH
jgi:hypothetical protein